MPKLITFWIKDKPVTILSDQLPQDIRPADEDFRENPFWVFNKDLKEEIVHKYFQDQPLSLPELWGIANYILRYAKNIACITYLMIPDERKEAYLKETKQCILRLEHIILNGSIQREGIQELLSICMEYGIDPF